MELRYIDANGVEKTVATPSALVHEIGTGGVTSATLVFDAKHGKWIRAAEHPDFVAVTSRNLAAPTEEDARLARRRSRIGWALFLLGIAMLSMASVLELSGAYLFGQSLIPLGLIALIASMASGKTRSPSRTANVRLLAGSAYALTCVLLLLNGVREQREQKREIEQLAIRFDNNVKVVERLGQGVGAPVSESTASRSSGSSNMAKMAEFMDSATRRTAEMGTNFQRALSNTNLERVLEPQRLISFEGRAEGRHTLKLVSAAVDDLERMQGDYEAWTRSEVKSKGFTPSFERDVLNGLAEGTAQTKAASERYIAVQREVVERFSDVLALMESVDGHISLKDDSLMFEQQAALDKYNALLAKIQALGEEEAKINENELSRQRRLRDSFKEMLASEGKTN